MKALSMSWLLVLLAFVGSARADLIAYWNFNTYDGNATTISSNAGTGTIAITGFPSTQLDNPTGTTINALFSDPAGTSLSLSNNANNGDFLTIGFSTLGMDDLVLSYASQRSSTGFNSNQWSYSNDGVSFTDFGSTVNPPTAFGLITVDFSSISTLDNDPTAFLRYTFSGATSSTGNNRIDNLQLNASAVSAVPEPGGMALAGFGAACLLGFRLRRALVFHELSTRESRQDE